MKREDLYESIDRQILSDRIYRMLVRKGLTKFNENRASSKRKTEISEKLYRAKIQSDLRLFFEAKNTVRYKSTGLNSLDDMFMNSNILTVLETAFNSLTTSKEQRDDYKNHVLQGILDLFKLMNPQNDPETAGAVNESLRYIFEQDEADISVEVTDEELPEDKIVGPERRDRDEAKEKEEDPRSDNADAASEEGDYTGRNKAQASIDSIEKTIRTFADDLGNAKDKEDFKTYCIANLRLYFSNWENALKNDIDPEFSPDVDKAVSDAEADIAAGKVADAGDEGDDAAADEGDEETEEEGGEETGDFDLELDL